MMYAKFGREWVRAYSHDHLTQSSLPTGHQPAELMVRRFLASHNKGERRSGAERLDTRIDQLNSTAVAIKESKTLAANNGKKPEANTDRTPDPFAAIDWSLL